MKGTQMTCKIHYRRTERDAHKMKVVLMSEYPDDNNNMVTRLSTILN